MAQSKISIMALGACTCFPSLVVVAADVALKRDADDDKVCGWHWIQDSF